MFIGHWAVGFASQRAAPRAPLVWLLTAPLLLDLLWPVFTLAGWESFHIAPGNTAFTPLAFDRYPWSHSLVMSLVWAALYAGLYLARHRDATGAAILAAGVTSHWVCDWISHGADMPLAPWSGTKVGLGLWNSVAGTIAVETIGFAAAVLVYVRATRALDRTGRWSLAALIATLGVFYVLNIVAPPPPSTTAVTVTTLAMAPLFVPWAAWIGRHRVVA